MSTASPFRRYLDQPATDGDLDYEEQQVQRDLRGDWQPVFEWVATLVADDDGVPALERLYSGVTRLHELIPDDRGIPRKEEFARRAGDPFRAHESVGVHAVRALAGLGLALASAESADETLRSAVAWYAEAHSSAAAPDFKPRDIGRAHPRLRPLGALLARLADEEGARDGALTAAVTLCALAEAAASPRRKPRAAPARTGWRGSVVRALASFTGSSGQGSGITVLLAGKAQGKADGVRALLHMSTARKLPAGLAPAPRRMALFAANPAFQESLRFVRAQTGARRGGRAVLWSIEGGEGPVPYIEGGSAGAAFAAVSDEVRRLGGRLAGIRVVGRLKSSNAIVGQLDERGYLQSVGGYESKFNALDEHAKVVVPSADMQKAEVPGKKRNLQVVAADRWEKAAKQARRPSPLVLIRQAVAVLAVLAIAAVSTALVQTNDAAAQQRAGLSSRLTSVADGLRGTDPGLAAQFDAAAYQADPTPAAYTDLLNDESKPLESFLPANLPAGNGTSAGGPDSALAISSAGNAVAVVNNFTLRLYDAADPGRAPATLGGQVYDVPARPLAFSPDGSVLAAVGAGDAISLWNVTDPVAPRRLSTLSTGRITALAFAARTPVLAVGTVDGDIQLWNAADPAHPVPLSGVAGPAAQGNGYALGAGSITTLMFAGAGDATLWAAASDGAIETWNTSEPAAPWLAATPLPAGAGGTVATSFSPTGSAVQTDSYGNSTTVDFGDNSQALLGNDLTPKEISTGKASPAVLSPDGQTIAVRDADGSMTLINRPANYPLEAPFPQNANESAGTPMNPLSSSPGLMAFNAAGTVLAADNDGDGISLWHLPAGYTIKPNLTTSDASPAGFTRSGAALLAINGSPESFASLPADAEVLALSEHRAVYATMDVADGTTLWEATSSSPPHKLGVSYSGSVIAATLSADGTVLALVSGQVESSESLQLWSLTDPAHPQRLGAPIAEHSSGVLYAMAISPDNQTLAMATPSGEVDLIPLSPGPGGRYGSALASNYDSQANPGAYGPAYTGVDGLDYSPDGTILTAVNGDDTLRVWNMRPAVAIAAVCAATGHSLTAATWQKYVSGAAFSPPCPAGATAGAAAPLPVAAPASQGAATGLCTAADLELAVGPVDRTLTRRLVITNVSHAACMVPGTPAVNLIGPSDADGSTFSLVAVAKGTVNQPNPMVPVTLAPGGKAHMDTKFLGFPPGQPLPTPPPASGYIYTWVPQQLQVVLPGSHGTLTAPWASGMSVLQRLEPHNPGNYYTPLVPGAS